MKNDYIQQFLILNLGKPLTSVQLNALALYDDIYKPPALAEKAFPLSMCEELGFRNHTSPLFGLIKSNGNRDGIIAESSINEFVTNVQRQILQTIGVRVYQELNVNTRAMFVEIMLNFWSAVANVFEDDWSLKSRDMKRTYITHGTSIIGFSYLCRHMLRVFNNPKQCADITLSSARHNLPTVKFFETELRLFREKCRFSSGYWSLGVAPNPEDPENKSSTVPYTRLWNDFQNTSSEKQLFATNILRLYEISKGLRKDYPIFIK